jgi:hypothetical protein
MVGAVRVSVCAANRRVDRLEYEWGPDVQYCNNGCLHNVEMLPDCILHNYYCVVCLIFIV